MSKSHAINALLAALMGSSGLPDGMGIIAIKIDPNSDLSEDEQIEQQIAAAKAEHEAGCEKCQKRIGEAAVQKAMDDEHNTVKTGGATMGTESRATGSVGAGSNQAGNAQATRKPFGYVVMLDGEPIDGSFNTDRSELEATLAERNTHPLGQLLLLLGSIAGKQGPEIVPVYRD